MITADHDNAERMIDPKTGRPQTAQASSPAPFQLMDEDSRGCKIDEGGALTEVAPMMLGPLGIDKPAEMTGRDLRRVNSDSSVCTKLPACE